MNFSVQCHCSCNQREGAREGEDGPTDHHYDANVPRPPSRSRERGLISYNADLELPLCDEPLKHGEVWHLCPEDGRSFQRAKLALHSNGYYVRPLDGSGDLMISWSPFSLVQACRLHSIEADEKMKWMRLFKISIFHHGVTHFFATQGERADADRARWVADISRALRMLTQSLFPTYEVRSDPLLGAAWTAMRLLAGYLLLCDDKGVSLVYCELHAHWDGEAQFAAYEDDYCDVQVVRLSVDMHTCVSERVGVDCSCFSLGGHHFNARTCAEKMLWLRVISNVKVKLRHGAANPTPTDLRHYRASILEYAKGLPLPLPEDGQEPKPMLPRRLWCGDSNGKGNGGGGSNGHGDSVPQATNGKVDCGGGGGGSAASSSEGAGSIIPLDGSEQSPSQSQSQLQPHPTPKPGASGPQAPLSLQPLAAFLEPDDGDVGPPPLPTLESVMEAPLEMQELPT